MTYLFCTNNLGGELPRQSPDVQWMVFERTYTKLIEQLAKDGRATGRAPDFNTMRLTMEPDNLFGGMIVRLGIDTAQPPPCLTED